jgi:phosphoglucomutase
MLTSQGLAEYVIQQVPQAKSKGVVLGRDHRHLSESFMRLAAAAFLERGFKVYWFRGFLNHTPLVPYGVKELGAACGVMITASHVSDFIVSVTR